MKINWIVRNILLAVGIIAAIIIIAFGSLNIITRHNRELTVPDFTNMSLEDALNLAEKRDVRLEVTDSVFVKRLGRGFIYSQNPIAGSKVKKGRRILITINAINPQMVEMPSLVGFRSDRHIPNSPPRDSASDRSYISKTLPPTMLEQRYNGQPWLQRRFSKVKVI